MPKKIATPPIAAPVEPIPAAAPRRAKKAPAATPPATPAVAQAAARPVVTQSTARVKAVKPAPVPPPPRKTTADFLREALAAKKASGGVGSPKLRPDMGNAKASKDAERRFGKSRKVH